MRNHGLRAFLCVVSLAALQTLPATAASINIERRFSQERWMLRQDGARTSPRPEVRVHFFQPNQTVRVSQRTGEARAVRPTFQISRPAPPRPLLIASKPKTDAPSLIASHEPGSAAAPQPEVRSGR